MAGSPAARNPRVHCGYRRSGRPVGAWCPSGFPSSTGSLGCLSGGRADGAPRCPPSPGARQPIRRSIRIAALGTGRRRHRCPTRTSPQSSSVPLDGRRRAADWRPSLPSSSAPPRSHPSPRTVRSACSRPPAPSAMPALRRLRSGYWQASRLDCSMSSGGRASSCCEDRSRWSSGAAAKPVACLLSAARRLEPLDPELARETYLEALAGAMSSDVEVVGGAPAVAKAARAAPTGTAPPRTVDVLLDAFAIRLTEGYAAAAPTLARALELLLAMDVSNEDVGRRLSLSSSRNGNIVALEMWDDEALHRLAARQVQVARDAGALVHLQFALSFLARSHMLAGDLTAATLTIDETRSIAEATGNPAPVNAPMILAAWRGDEARASELIQATSEEAAARRWTSNNYARCRALQRPRPSRRRARCGLGSVPARSDRIRLVAGGRAGRGGIADR